ncbi:hypothetical protein [Sulfurimonas sp.]
MKNIILSLILAFAFIGCNSKSDESKNVEAKLVVGKSLADFKVNDQNEKPQTIAPGTKIVFFSFSKKVGHLCNKFLEKKPADFLAQNNAVYVADVSPAPSLIKKLFILPDLKDLKFPILLINNDRLSAEYSKNMNKESIVVVILDNDKIVKIENLKDTASLDKLFKK